MFTKVVSTVDVFAPNRTLVLPNLQPFVKYGASISAFTEGGVGVLSDVKTAGNFEHYYHHHHQ